MCASLEQLVKTNWQQDSRRTSQFEALRRDGLQTLKELQQIREANEKTLQKNREYYEKKLQEIGKLHNKILDENREYNEQTLRHSEQQDLAVTESLMKLSSRLGHISDLSWESTIEYRVLDSLSDMGMTARYEKIADAHAQTFEWIFQDYTRNTGSHSRNTFIEWLTHGTGIFWVTGKPGSGKSTLMKFLSHHRLTSEILTHWSGTKKLIIGSFYFWYAGTEFQKSQEGLLRSLLCEIFRQCPELMQIVLPQYWDSASPLSGSSHITWNRSELIAAFDRLALYPNLTCVFCFFIDGLDEFDGDHNEIVVLIQGFAKSENIKWCLSSRPWNVFRAAFGNGSNPSFKLENLTKEDISLYVRDELEGNEAFRNLKRREGIACATLVEEIVDKAEGVFLWVFLVVRSLKSGLQNADRVMDLQRRLQHFPSDLEAYFQHMLNNIDDNYLQQTAQTFLLALQAAEPLSLMTYAMVDELEIDPSYALNLGIQQMSSAEITAKHSDMKLRINARCKDLLEVTPVSYKCSPSFYDYKVDFLHRTVRDFLHLKEIYEWVLGNVSCGFNVDQSLCAAFLAQVKTVSVQKEDFQGHGQLSPLVDRMVHYARQIESRTNTSPTQLLDCFYYVLPHRYRALEVNSDIWIREPSFESCINYWEINGSLRTSLKLLCFAPIAFSVHRDLQLYVKNKMDDRQGDMSLYHDEYQLVSSAIYPYQRSAAYEKSQTNYSMLHLLISRGVNPNCVGYQPELRERACDEVYGFWLEKAQCLELLETSTIHMPGPREHQWVMYVLRALRWRLRYNRPLGSILSGIIETFLQRGVNPNWVYGKHSLWTYFTACLYSDRLSGKYYYAESQKWALRVLKAFYRRGVSRSQIIMHEMTDNASIDAETLECIPDVKSIQYKKEGDMSRALDAHAAIRSMIPAEGMQELEFAGKKKASRRTARKRRKKNLVC